ncbi:MAG: leucine-rich repeat protein, partial [Muribaculaceae bacterium]|nr:leucine-rich repeat protein [Muribaculaceae bacterium]
VYHPDVLLGSGAYVATDVETNTFNGKKYLMTEFGDSVLCGASGITSVTTSRMKHLERIGNYAFNGSGIKEFTIPSSIKNIGLKAFVGCKNLSELFITQPTNNYSWAGHFYGDNASAFTCYVKWTSLPDLQKSVTNWTRYNNVNPLDQLNGYVQLSTDNKAMAIAVNHPVDWTASGLNAYVVSKYDPATQTVTTGTAGKSSANKGVLVTDFTKDQIYKLKRPIGTIYNKTNLLVGAADAAVNVYQQPGGFLFDGAKKYFWKPTSTYNLTRGYAYLKLDEAAAGSTSRVYVDLWPYTPTPDFKKGDVNGDGVVDITDVNILLNIVLGKDKASNYGNRADVDGNGEVDITDVNTALNIVLGK